MFSGIIESVGRVENLSQRNDQVTITVRADSGFAGLELGESVAVNGVCLTVCEMTDKGFSAILSGETIQRTNFKSIAKGGEVNLERSLTPTQKISGHFVFGHVDQVGSIVDIQKTKSDLLFRFQYPKELDPYIVEKGSIAIDGISLTVFSCQENQFTVTIIPHTIAMTNLKSRKIGDLVNLECDMIGKYVFKACAALLGKSPESEGVSVDLLRRHNFL